MFADHNCVVIIPSCDAYGDLWAPFLALFQKFWPDCPFPVILGTNTAEFTNGKVIGMPCPGGNVWSIRVKYLLDTIESKNIILCLEDYFLTRAVDNSRVHSAIEIMERAKAVTMRLTPKPPPDRRLVGHPDFGEVLPGAPFRVSTQIGVWDRAYLAGLLAPAESIWDFELIGSRRSDQDGRLFLGSWEDLLPYEQVVERGKWFRWAARKYGRASIGCDLSRRDTMSKPEGLKKLTNGLRWKAVNAVPWKIRRQALGWIGSPFVNKQFNIR